MIRIDSQLDEQGIAVIRLASPEISNALKAQDMAALINIIEGYQAEDSGARALILTGSDNVFSAGANLDALGDTGDIDIEKKLRDLLLSLEESLSQGRLPTIAAVNGSAAGGAVGIALLCDIVLAAQSAKFFLPFSRLGLLPDTGLTHLLPRLIGEARAKAIAFIGGDISADQAERWGLIYAVYPDKALVREAQTLAEQLGNAPPGSICSIRLAFIKARENTLPEQINLECHLQAKAIQSEGFQKAIAVIRQRKL